MGKLAIALDDVLAAQRRLRGVVRTTPICTSRTLDESSGRQVFLKCESFQRAGSFKIRGAYNAVSQLDRRQREVGVVAFSSGNHAQGVALAARLLAIPAVICMPDDAPAIKVEAARGYGAEVVGYERRTTDREALAQGIAAERELTLIPPYDHPHVMAGQGTAAIELIQAIPDLDALVVPVGGGGLISGCAVAAKALAPGIRIFGVETEGADDTKLSLDSGERVTIPAPSTIADGIRTPSPGSLTFPVVQQLVEDVFVVSDEEVRTALRFLMLRLKLVVEPTGAVALAAVVRGALPDGSRRVGVMVSGGNVDPAFLADLWPA